MLRPKQVLNSYTSPSFYPPDNQLVSGITEARYSIAWETGCPLFGFGLLPNTKTDITSLLSKLSQSGSFPLTKREYSVAKHVLTVSKHLGIEKSSILCPLSLAAFNITILVIRFKCSGSADPERAEARPALKGSADPFDQPKMLRGLV